MEYILSCFSIIVSCAFVHQNIEQFSMKMKDNDVKEDDILSDHITVKRFIHIIISFPLNMLF